MHTPDTRHHTHDHAKLQLKKSQKQVAKKILTNKKQNIIITHAHRPQPHTNIETYLRCLRSPHPYTHDFTHTHKYRKSQKQSGS